MIIKVPGINAPQDTRACRNAGNLILEQLKTIYTNEKGKSIPVQELEEIHVDNSNLEEQDSLIYKNALDSFNSQEKLIFLGGDHSISYSTCGAFLDYCKKRREQPYLIVFDAHPDCMPPMKEPSHEEWFRALVEKGFPKNNILLIGLRNSDPQELEFLNKNKIKQLSINELNNHIEEATDILTEFAKGPLYVSFDIDVIDPVFAPATGYLEPGGLSSRQALYIMSRVSLIKNLQALDIVELNIDKDKPHGITSKLAAKILAEFL